MNNENIVKRSISEEKIWSKYYPEASKYEQAPKMKILDYLKFNNVNKMNLTALNYYGTKITYKKLIAKIEEAANAFHKLGVKAGDTVSFVAVAVPECIYAVYALNKLGAACNMIDPRMDEESIKRMVIESESRFLVALDVTYPKVFKVRQYIDQEKTIIIPFARSLPFIKRTVATYATSNVRTYLDYDNRLIKWDTFLADGVGTVAPDAEYVGDRLVAIAYTGGTTGFPKGVMLTNDSVNAVAYSFKYAGLVQGKKDKFLGIIPIFSSYGFVCGTHMPLCLGLELIPIPRFIPTQFGKLIKQFKPHHMISTPAFIELLMNSKEIKNMDLSFITTLGSGGDTMNEGLEEKLNNWMKQHNIKYPLAQGYGMSELSAAATFSVNELFKSGSVGIPSIGITVSIFDPETGEEKGYYEEGEICVTGGSMMKGYYKREEETANVMRKHADGLTWIHSGDIGYIDEDGFLFVKGRIKRMIIRFDGHKVFPVNIESAIVQEEAVKNCCVVGVNDRSRSQGQYPMAIVELNEGYENKEEICKQIFDKCNEVLEERGRPVCVVAIDKIPLTGQGKNDYKTLEKEFVDFDYITNENK